MKKSTTAPPRSRLLAWLTSAWWRQLSALGRWFIHAIHGGQEGGHRHRQWQKDRGEKVKTWFPRNRAFNQTISCSELCLYSLVPGGNCRTKTQRRQRQKKADETVSLRKISDLCILLEPNGCFCPDVFHVRGRNPSAADFFSTLAFLRRRLLFYSDEVRFSPSIVSQPVKGCKGSTPLNISNVTHIVGVGANKLQIWGQGFVHLS